MTSLSNGGKITPREKKALYKKNGRNLIPIFHIINHVMCMCLYAPGGKEEEEGNLSSL